MGRFRQALSTYKRAIRGELEVDPSQLTPEQRARYEEAMARGEAEKAAARERNREWQQQVSDASVLRGPALPDHAKHDAVLDLGSPREMLKQSLRNAKDEFRAAAAETAAAFGPTEVDPVAQADELAARARARAPYRAAVFADVVITRVATRGETQLLELAEHLQRSGLAARPDLVHGVYRVPDRIRPNRFGSEKNQIVEWAMVHHPAALSPTTAPIDSAAFSRHAQLIARRLGEPAVLDEEVAALYCLHANVAPEWCLGFARVPDFHTRGGGEAQASFHVVDVVGITVLHRPTEQAPAARTRFAQEAPLADTFPAVHHEVLDWEAIRERVQSDRLSPAAAPSPLPHLPASAEELLLAYLEVVGVQPADSYGAQVTVTRHHSLDTAGIGPKLPSADGEPHRRLHCAEHVVLSYRDRTEYVEGRARWAAYQREVLQARLDHLTERRPTLESPERSGFDRLANAVGVLADPIYALDSWLDREERPPSPFPYCWPPV